MRAAIWRSLCVKGLGNERGSWGAQRSVSLQVGRDLNVFK